MIFNYYKIINGKVFSDKIIFIFLLLNGSLLLFKYLNIDPRLNSHDYLNGFRILPDYITNSVMISYKKERKRLLLN
jgi:hypothetical protein